MPYEHRTSGRRWRHDPAAHGIFIHGGTCCAGTFGSGAQPNQFSITTPGTNRRGEELSKIYLHENLPTFQRAVDRAKRLRLEMPALIESDIFACTDLHQLTRCSGFVAVQRVA